jgi:hypothetical protein
VRRVLLAVVACTSLFGLSAVAAEAGPTKSIDYTLSGTSVWSPLDVPSSFAISGDVASGNHSVGTYSGTITISGFSPCAEPDNPYGPQCASPTGGTITFDLRGGSVTTSVDGGIVWQLFQTPSFDGYVFDLDLSVTSGTHAYASAEGTLALHYETARSKFSPDPVTFVPCVFVDLATCPITDGGELTGTITR